MDFLDQETSKYPSLSGDYQKFADLYQGKLWHQLTDAVSEAILKEEFDQGRNMIDLYENFVTKFEGKINQLKFVQIASVVARQYCKSKPFKSKEVEDAIGFLEHITEKRARLGEEAFIVARMAIAELYVQLGGDENMKQARVIMDESQPIIQSLAGSGAETVVNSSFYRVSCEYYKAVGPADEFYKACIQFLAYTPQETLEPKVQERLAVDMSLAALVGETVFNYGEVLAQPILKVLDGGEFAWLNKMLQAFSAGDIDGFTTLCTENKAALDSQPILTHNFEILRQKIALLCLMQVIFRRPPHDRQLTLKEVAVFTKLEQDQVEWLLMKAMSKGLIKGEIDQVEQMVHVSWLKPRVLDMDQLATLRDKLNLWQERVGTTLNFIEGETPELFQ